MGRGGPVLVRRHTTLGEEPMEIGVVTSAETTAQPSTAAAVPRAATAAAAETVAA